MATQNITLDGVNNFTAFGTTSSWSGLNINYISVGIDPGSDPNEPNTLNATLSGGAWRIRHLNLFNDIAFDYDATLTDSNAGVFRRIDRFEFSGPGDVAVSLLDTRIRFMTVSEAASMTLTLGSQRMNSLESDAATNAVTLGTGSLTYARLGVSGIASVNSVNGDSGFVNHLEFSEDSTNTITNGGFFFNSVVTEGDVNNFTFSAGGDSLSLGSGVSTVNLTAGFYGSLLSFSGTNTVTVGADAEVRSIGFSGGVDVINVAGSVEQISVGSNNDRVEITGNGRVNSVLLGDGNNTFILNGQNAWAVTAFQGNDTANITSGEIDQLYLGGGNNTITVETAFVGQIRTNEGADKLTIVGGDIQQVTLGDGKNTMLLRSGFVKTFQAGDGADKITARDGAIETIHAGRGNNTVVTGSGWTVLVDTREGRDNITIGSGRAFAVRSGEGNDTISAVDGRIDFLEAGDGNDTVTLGALGARFVVLGDGDDVLSIAPAVPEWGIEVQGDGGVDTVDLSRFTANLTLDLGTSQWQNPAAPGGAGSPPAQGYLAMIQVENAIGGTGADAITGSEDDNELTGGRGADTLSGGDGNDTLVGGRDNDSLTGGLGEDVFRFLQADGRDVIADFTQGDDLIELREANGLGDLTITQNGADVRIDFGALRITVQNAIVADIADAANFLF
jgi:Ca2+-binding RTX toxin-like protein